MARNERHVVPDPQGGWSVKKPHAERASEHCDTRAEAADHARDVCRNENAECVIHGRDGKIQESKGGLIVTRRGYVVALGEGKEGIHNKFHEVFETKGEAVDRARDICRNENAECVIHGRDGRIQNSKNYGSDPCPPKDK
jgi:uncharacterized protein YdaT